MARYLSPAKLNLFLHVTGRRTNGYHALQTVFQLLDYGDEIEIEPRCDGLIRRLSELPGLSPEDDLCIRAARALRDAAEVVGHDGLGADIRLHKHLPVGGGLGGGSSNAATVLRALNVLWGVNLPLSELAAIGLRLGADVPVFVRGQNAWAEGIGEELLPVRLPRRWFSVVTPAVEAFTADVFNHSALTRNTPKLRILDFVCTGSGAPFESTSAGPATEESRNDAGEVPFLDVERLEMSTHNDCQSVVVAVWDAVGDVLERLARFGPARMTGTGASVFAAFETQAEAQDATRELSEVASAFVARGIA